MRGWGSSAMTTRRAKRVGPAWREPGVRGGRSGHRGNTDRPDAYAPSDATAAPPGKITRPAPMAFPPGMDGSVRPRACGAVTLSLGPALSRAQSDLDPDAVALGDGRARRAKLRADRAHGAGAAGDRHCLRGRPLLQPSRRRLAGDPRAAGGCRRYRRGAGRVDYYPADRQKSVPVAGAQFPAQGVGASARAVDGSRAAETACA